jgi:hypothetical protein
MRGRLTELQRIQEGKIAFLGMTDTKIQDTWFKLQQEMAPLKALDAARPQPLDETKYPGPVDAFVDDVIMGKGPQQTYSDAKANYDAGERYRGERIQAEIMKLKSSPNLMRLNQLLSAQQQVSGGNVTPIGSWTSRQMEESFRPLVGDTYPLSSNVPRYGGLTLEEGIASDNTRLKEIRRYEVSKVQGFQKMLSNPKFFDLPEEAQQSVLEMYNQAEEDVEGVMQGPY